MLCCEPGDAAVAYSWICSMRRVPLHWSVMETFESKAVRMDDQ